MTELGEATRRAMAGPEIPHNEKEPMKIPQAVKLAKVEARIGVVTGEISACLREREDLIAERAELRGDEGVWSTGEQLARQVIAELELEYLKIDTSVFVRERPRDETAFWTNVFTVKQIVEEVVRATHRLALEKKGGT